MGVVAGAQQRQGEQKGKQLSHGRWETHIRALFHRIGSAMKKTDRISGIIIFLLYVREKGKSTAFGEFPVTKLLFKISGVAISC